MVARRVGEVDKQMVSVLLYWLFYSQFFHATDEIFPRLPLNWQGKLMVAERKTLMVVMRAVGVDAS